MVCLPGCLALRNISAKSVRTRFAKIGPSNESIHILDASALVAYANAEPGGTVVRALLADPAATCYAHTMNLCEVYYHLIRQMDVRRARLGIRTLFADGVIERHDMNRRFLQRVGELKAQGRISLPDCFCISLAQELAGEVVTSPLIGCARMPRMPRDRTNRPRHSVRFTDTSSASPRRMRS